MNRFDYLRPASVEEAVREEVLVERGVLFSKAPHGDPAFIEDASAQRLSGCTDNAHFGAGLDSLSAPRDFLGVNPWEAASQPALRMAVHAHGSGGKSRLWSFGFFGIAVFSRHGSALFCTPQSWTAV